ncbi:hypothetical protein BKP56_05160 [Marinilactibacillus sp. 15R]|uniref:DUF2264 domain-containing protein n=1 Tax=Marinilactibacillus sp. 15R TaxID=1911586 RepID=UPI00090A15F4|nr:DUF2264 domain-containing protein [Marinilactibacillus sp. 15R]API88713.1 hypothetical protein BKP56_05160 [Marinilactibacillus sp. 15R]
MIEEGKQSLADWMDQLTPNNFKYLNQLGASYLPEIRLLEGSLRPLWGILPAYFSGVKSEKCESYIKNLKEMVEKQKLPPISTKNRQIAVETAVLSYAIGTYKHNFFNLFSTEGQQYLVDWLNEVNQIDIPKGNWLFFVILINSSLKENRLKYSKEKLEWALKEIDTLYLGDGWYTDGENKQRDYYIAFAFHFYGLLYSRISKDEFAEKFLDRAIKFSKYFTHWFDAKGRSIPFGRSLTYRFAHVCYWSALVVTGAYKETTLSLSEIKGIIYRNLNFWSTQPIQISSENPPSIGYSYGNLLLSEDYNSLGSTMWAFKTFILLELEENHPFWKCSTKKLEQNSNKEIVQPHAGFHFQHSDDHTLALSSTQYSTNHLLYHHHEKYSKFAYSSYFGFNLSRGSENIEKTSVDSTLSISISGHEQYQPRSRILKSKIYKEYGVSYWDVWRKVKIYTYLIPISSDVHIRIHEIETPYNIDVVEGGFPLFNWNKKYSEPLSTKSSIELKNENGISSIIDLSNNRVPIYVDQGPNTNIYSYEKNAIPALTTTLTKGKYTLSSMVVGSPRKKMEIPKIEISSNVKEYKVVIEEKNICIQKENFKYV